MRRAQAEAAAGVTAKSARDLLPANVVPRHYDVTIEPDLEKFTFEGKVAIDLDVAEESKSISVHTLDLKLHEVKVESNGSKIGYGCHKHSV
jgi:aminopeptidase 2